MQNVNNILDTIDISNESGPVTEPVTLTEMKNYLRLEGFIDDNDSTSVPAFDDDDSDIEDFITEARDTLEKELNVSIIEHTWRAIGVTNEAGMVQLWYGPVTALLSVVNSEGDTVDVDNTEIIGDHLSEPNYCNMTVEYTAGYSTIPKAIINEIKRMVAYQYEHKGDEDGLEGYKYTSNVMKHSRKAWLI